MAGILFFLGGMMKDFWELLKKQKGWEKTL